MYLLKFLLVIFFAVCVAIGGQGKESIGPVLGGKKWIGRFVGGIGFGAGIWALAFLARQFGILVGLAGAWYCPSLCIFKYGVNDGSLFKKVLLRAIYGGSLGLAGLLAGIATGHAFLGVLQLLLGAAGSAFFGVVNPFSKLGDRGVMLEVICIILCAAGLVPFFF